MADHRARQTEEFYFAIIGEISRAIDNKIPWGVDSDLETVQSISAL